VGKLLKLYKFPDNRRAGGTKKYLLSKSSVGRIINLYFNETTQNNTNNTQQHKQHKITQKEEDVPLCVVCAITNKTAGDDFSSEEFTLNALRILQEEVGKLIPIEKINRIAGLENFHEILPKLKNTGKVFEPKDGFVQLTD
jgi:hypothetical protein